VYLAGNIEPILINVIGEKLARAGVQDARLYKGIPDRNPEDWRDYLNRLREEAKAEESNICQLPVTKRAPKKKRAMNLSRVSKAVMMAFSGSLRRSIKKPERLLTLKRGCVPGSRWWVQVAMAQSAIWC
jgi:hypothetical protein